MITRFKEELVTRISAIDSAHRVITALFDEFEVLIKGDSTKEPIDLLCEIYLECVKHFLKEEFLMAETNYKEIHIHAGDHDDLLKKMKSFISIFHGQSILKKKEILVLVQDMILSWILPHFENTDKHFAEYYHNLVTNLYPSE